MKCYPVADRLNAKELNGLEVEPSFTSRIPKNVKAIRKGEKRPPQKGEWYLSGAIPMAYRAPNDLTTEYQIMALVKVKEVTTVKVEKVLAS